MGRGDDRLFSTEDVREQTLAADRIAAKLSRAPANDRAIGGLKIVCGHAYFEF